MEPGNMDHGGEAARPTTVESEDHLRMAGAVHQGGEPYMSTGTVTFHNSAELARHVRATAARGEAPGVVYPNIGEFWRQLGLVDVALLRPHLPDGGVVQVLDNYGYAVLQPRPGAGHGVVLVGLLPGGVGAVHNGDYALQPRPDIRHREVLVNLLPDGTGHDESFVGHFTVPGGGGGAAYDEYVYYVLLPRPGDAGHDVEVLVDLLPDGAGHGEVFVGLLPGGLDAVYDNYGHYTLQPRTGAPHGEVFIGPHVDGVGEVFDNSGNFSQQAPPGMLHADGIAGMLRDLNLGAGYDVSVALANDLGTAYNNRATVSEHLRRLRPFAGIGACSVAINWLAAGPGSPAVAFHLFALLLGGLFLVILHVLRV